VLHNEITAKGLKPLFQTMDSVKNFSHLKRDEIPTHSFTHSQTKRGGKVNSNIQKQFHRNNILDRKNSPPSTYVIGSSHKPSSPSTSYGNQELIRNYRPTPNSMARSILIEHPSHHRDLKSSSTINHGKGRHGHPME
jgi:hypothetical protein